MGNVKREATKERTAKWGVANEGGEDLLQSVLGSEMGLIVVKQDLAS